jgi:hypothetical protein
MSGHTYGLYHTTKYLRGRSGSGSDNLQYSDSNAGATAELTERGNILSIELAFGGGD